MNRKWLQTLATAGLTVLATHVPRLPLCPAACPPQDTAFSVRFQSPVESAAVGWHTWCIAAVTNGEPPVVVRFVVVGYRSRFGGIYAWQPTNVVWATITNPPYVFVATYTNTPSGLTGLPSWGTSVELVATATDRSNNSVTSAPVVIAGIQAGPQSPDLTIVSPAAGATIPSGTPFSISAVFSDGFGLLLPVSFYAGTNALGTVEPWPGLVMITAGFWSVPTEPYTLTVSNLPPGNYDLTASASDPDPLGYGVSPPMHITVLPADAPPSVTLLSLAFPATTYLPSSLIRLEAQAFDPDGSIEQIKFYATAIGNPTILANLGTASNFPPTLLWTNQLAPGTYVVKADAIDNGGMKSLSPAQEIIQVTSALSPPVVDILAPTNGTRIAWGANFAILAQLTISDNNINPLEFYVGTNLVGRVLNPPYQVQVSNLAVGTYTISARIKSLSGLASTGALAQVSISDFLLHPTGMSADGSFRVHIGGLVVGTTNVVEVSPDLTAWWPTATNVVATNYLDFVDVGAANDCQRFYRCVRVPW